MNQTSQGKNVSTTAVRLLRIIGRLLPPIPYATGVFNRLVKPLLFSRTTGYRRVPVNGVLMDLDPNECVDGALYFYPHLYDRQEISFLRRHVRPGDVFVDAGAHVGFYSLMLASQVPGVQCLCIEADPFTAERVRGHVELNGFQEYVSVVERGISDRNEVQSLGLQLNGNRGGNSFLHSHQQQVTIRCAPLLEILREQRIERITAMKMDIEGFEYKVLSQFFTDAPSTLWPSAIVIEYVHDQPNTGDVIQLLLDRGYAVERKTKMNSMLVRKTRGD